MHRTSCRWLLPAALIVAVSAAQAQKPPRPAAPSDPLDASAHAPAFVYRSTLGAYRRLGDDTPVPWREANETVGRVGGWRAYAREAAEPAAPASAATMPAGDAGQKRP